MHHLESINNFQNISNSQMILFLPTPPIYAKMLLFY
jgi:hypothetical protein